MNNSQTINLSIVIPTWCNYSQLDSLLESIRSDVNNWEVTCEIIVVDDSPLSKRKQIQCENLKVIATSGNTRFANAANIALHAATGSYILLLNDDIVVLPGSIRILYDKIKDITDCVVPQLLLDMQTIQPSIRKLPDTKSIFWTMVPFFSETKGIKLKKFDYTKESNVEQPYFSVIMFSRSVFERVGFIDTQYPMYFNDVDWAKRASIAGVNIRYIPQAKFIHYHGISGDKLGFTKEIYWVRGLKKYLDKYYGGSWFSRVRINIVVMIISVFKTIFFFYKKIRIKLKILS